MARVLTAVRPNGLLLYYVPPVLCRTECYKRIAIWKYHDRRNETATASIKLESFIGLHSCVVAAHLARTATTETRIIKALCSKS